MVSLQQYQQELIQAALEGGALKFGTFTLKSGRISPYFFNAGLLCTGPHVLALANGYATLIATHFRDSFDVIFGPAYKGIPLAACTAMLLHKEHAISVGYAFDRKEAKGHGEGGMMVGAPMKGKRVIILDDVMTAGTAVRHSMKLIQEEGGEVVGFVMCLDREEVGPNGESTVRNVEESIGRPGSLKSILRMSDLTGWLTNQGSEEQVEAMMAYRAEYGIKSVATVEPQESNE